MSGVTETLWVVLAPALARCEMAQSGFGESMGDVANLAASVCPGNLPASGHLCEIRLLPLQSLRCLGLILQVG